MPSEGSRRAPLPVIVLDAQHQVVLRDAGVVHENVARRRTPSRHRRRALQHVGGHGDVAREPARARRLRAATASAFALSRPTTATLAPHAASVVRDRAADAARAPRDERDLARQVDLHCDTRSRRAFTSATVPHVMAGLSGASRFSRPVSTLPGPISTKSAPGCAAAMA